LRSLPPPYPPPQAGEGREGDLMICSPGYQATNPIWCSVILRGTEVHDRDKPA
jgi:hypothetical protein